MQQRFGENLNFASTAVTLRSERLHFRVHNSESKKFTSKCNHGPNERFLLQALCNFVHDLSHINLDVQIVAATLYK